MIKNSLLIISSTCVFGWFTYTYSAAGNGFQPADTTNPMRYLQETIVQKRFAQARQYQGYYRNVRPAEIMAAEILLHNQAASDARTYLAGWHIARALHSSTSLKNLITHYVDKSLSQQLDAISLSKNIDKYYILMNNDWFNVNWFGSIASNIILTIDYINIYRALEDLRQHGDIVDAQDVLTYDTTIHSKFVTALENNAQSLTLHEPHQEYDDRWQKLSVTNPFVAKYIEKKRQELFTLQTPFYKKLFFLTIMP